MLWLCLSSRFSLDIILKVDLEAIDATLRLWTDFTEAYFCPQGNTQILYDKKRYVGDNAVHYLSNKFIINIYYLKQKHVILTFSEYYVLAPEPFLKLPLAIKKDHSKLLNCF